MLQPPLASAPLELPLTLFLNDLANCESDSIFILDDYQEIVDPRFHETLTYFIEHLPPQVHMIILTRNEPPLPLVQWHARGEIQELTGADLRFSPQETTIFFQDTTTSALSEQTITQLDTLLEGWPAGLRLLAMAGQMMHGGVEYHLSHLVERQSSDSIRNQLLDYFLSEVLASQPEALQHFLLQTSELPRLTGPLCDEITDSQNSAALLETLERTGLFLETLDETQPWYRYSSLFAEALRVEARRRLGEETLRGISRRASLWYEQHAQAAEAIEAALHAQDVERAGVLIERLGERGQRYELHTLRGWLELIPDEVLGKHPLLCFYAAITLQFQQEQALLSQPVNEHIEVLLQRAEEGWLSLGKVSWVGLVIAFRALTTSLREPTSQEAVAHATKALTLLPAGATEGGDDKSPGMLEWRAICLGIAGSAAMHQGRFVETRQLLQEALTLCQEGPNQQFLGEINVRLGAACMALGELHMAAEYYRQALSAGRSQEPSDDTMRALSGLAQLSFEWNDLEASEQQVREALDLAQTTGMEGSERAAYLLVLLCTARGQDTAASFQLAALLARLQAASTQEAQELLPEALALQVRLHLAAGDNLAAQRRLTLLENSVQEPSFDQQMLVNILQARLRLAQGEAYGVSLLENTLSRAQEKRHLRSQLEIQILLALAQADRKQKAEARTRLQQALSQAHGEGFLRVFLAEGEPMAYMLRSLLPGMREKVLRSYGQTILRAFTRPGEALSVSSSSDFDVLPLEPLSPQERRILRLLAAGRTNPEIARELVISVNTVKDHLKHLYSKLNVSNRLEAYEVARHLEQF